MSLNGRYLPFRDKGPGYEGRGMNFSLKISSEALRISCLRPGHTNLGVTPYVTAVPQPWRLPGPTDTALVL